MAELRCARVVRFNADNTANIILLDDGGFPIPNVPVMCDVATSQSGSAEMPTLDPVPDNLGLPAPGQRYSIAIVGSLRGSAVIIGFLPPSVREIIFADARTIKRFPNDVYVSSEQNGDTEVYHPSGISLRMAQNPGHEDLTGADVSGNWKLRRNLANPVYMSVAILQNGMPLASYVMDPKGNVQVSASGSMVFQAKRIMFQATDSIIEQAPVLTKVGDVNASGTIRATGDVQAGLVSLQQHGHAGVQVGESVSTTPLGGGPSAASFGMTTSPSAPRGLRNNNPGNLRYNPNIQWQGQIGQDAAGFALFDSPFHGLRALSLNLVNQQNQDGLGTVSQIITKFAPPSENDTASYIANVSASMGVGPNDMLNLNDPQVLQSLTSAVVTQENGSMPYGSFLQAEPAPGDPFAALGQQAAGAGAGSQSMLGAAAAAAISSTVPANPLAAVAPSGGIIGSQT
ncbi:MAG TPA: hypothetical protein VNX47_05930 [Nevskia sp.]|jgi:hypothetical protein|nr:hypothetical protein [Nevskia sp.]